MMERGLYELSLLLPQGAVAGDQAFAGKRTKGAFDQPRLIEFLRLLGNSVRGVGGVALIGTTLYVADGPVMQKVHGGVDLLLISGLTDNPEFLLSVG